MSDISIIDLSIKIDDGMPVYPGDPLFRREIVACHDLDGFCVSELTLGSHLGTHIDAPFHFFADGERLDSFALDEFYGPAALIDLTPPTEDELNVISWKMLEPFSDILETVPKIIIRTGWSAHWGRDDYYTRFPSITPETAEWLADYPVRLLGIESPSLSSFPRSEQNDISDEVTLHSDAESHRILLGRRPPVLILEGLTNLQKLPDRFILSCMPIPVANADGAPVRAVAIF